MILGNYYFHSFNFVLSFLWLKPQDCRTFYFQKNLQDKSKIAHNLLEHAKHVVNLADNTTSFLPRYFYDLRASHLLKKTKKAQDTSDEAAYKLAAAAILAKRHLDLTKS